jgi:hypothetical protein
MEHKKESEKEYEKTQRLLDSSEFDNAIYSWLFSNKFFMSPTLCKRVYVWQSTSWCIWHFPFVVSLSRSISGLVTKKPHERKVFQVKREENLKKKKLFKLLRYSLWECRATQFSFRKQPMTIDFCR